jgi:hypothetical protein
VNRRCYTRLVDVLIPATDGMPRASEVGVPGTLIDKALIYRPDLAAAFEEALALADGLEAGEAVEILAAKHADEFAALTLLTTGAYYLSTEVRQLLGLGAGQPRQVHDDTETYVEMLQQVVERGPVFRSV